MRAEVGRGGGDEDEQQDEHAEKAEAPLDPRQAGGLQLGREAVRADGVEGKMTIDVNLTDAYGISRYPLGKDGLIDIKVAKRSSKSEKPKVTIKTNMPLEVTLIWGDNQKAVTNVKTGSQTI